MELGFPWENEIRTIEKVGMGIGFGHNKLGNGTKVQFGLKNEIYSRNDSMTPTFSLVTQFPFLLLQDLFYTLSVLPLNICVSNYIYRVYSSHHL